MTEEEARKKWCPMVRFAGQVLEPAYNRTNSGITLQQHDKCIASDCMMWRWTFGKEDNRELYGDHTGYCGLRGKP